MNRFLVIAACCVAVAGCGKKAATGATDDDGNAVAPASAAAPAAAPAAQASAAATAPAAADDAQRSSLDASDPKLATGQYYEGAPLKVNAGETIYIDVNASFKPVIVILDANKQKVSESQALTQNADKSWSISYSEEFKDAGQYYALFAAEQAGATGPYSVKLRRGRKIG